MSAKPTQVPATTEKVDISVVDELPRPIVDEAAECQNTVIAIRRLIWKLDWRLMPFFAFLEFCSYLNRINIGDAKLTNMTTDLHMSASESNWIVSMFYVAYLIFAIPSILLLRFLGTTTHLSLCMLTWGSFPIGMAFATNAKTLLALRFLLGVAEAGVFPGVIIYISFWYRKREQAMRMAIFFGAAVFATAASGILAYGIIQMNGVAGLKDWQWIFLLESLPIIPLSIITFFFLRSIPETVQWLNNCEKELLTSILREDQGMANSEPLKSTWLSWTQVRHAFVDWRVYLYGLISLGISTAFICLANFLPSMIEGIEHSVSKVHLLVAPPYALACLCCLVVGYSSSHRNEHCFHIIFPLCVALLGFILMATLTEQGNVAIYVSTCVACCGTFPGYVILLSWLTNNVGGHTKRSISVGFAVGIGQIGGIVAPLVYRNVDKPTYRRGHIIIAGVVASTLIIVIVLRMCLARENRRRNHLSREEYLKEAAVKEPCDWHPEVRYVL